MTTQVSRPVAVNPVTGALTFSPDLDATYAPVAPAYVTGRAYAVGELVVYSGALYRITTAYTSSGGSLDLTKATAVGATQGYVIGVALALG